MPTKAKKPDWEHYYNWPNTINKMEGAGATGCFVVGANDLGKTFGIRYMAVLRFITRESGRGRQFAEVCRNEGEISKIASGYCEKLKMSGMFPGYAFDSKGGELRIKICADGEDPKDSPEPWETMGYIVSLSARMRSKRVTYPDVGYVIMDEVVIEYDDKYHRYFNDEWSKLERLCVALWRERPDKKSEGRLFLLGNSVDIGCPYFEHLGVGIPEHGQRWCLGKNWLFDYPQPNSYRLEKLKETTVYRLFHGADRSALLNEFAQNTDKFVAEKPEDAVYKYAVVLRGDKYGVWMSDKGQIHITRKLPADWGKQTKYALTTADNEPNYQLARRTSPIFKVLIRAYVSGNMYFSDSQTRERFTNVLQLFGLR